MEWFSVVEVDGISHYIAIDELPIGWENVNGKCYLFVCVDTLPNAGVKICRYDGSLDRQNLEAVVLAHIDYNILKIQPQNYE